MRYNWRIGFLMIAFLMTLGLIGCKSTENSESLRIMKEKQATERRTRQLQDSLNQAQQELMRDKAKMAVKLESYQDEVLKTRSEQRQNLLLKQAGLESKLAAGQQAVKEGEPRLRMTG